MTAVARGDDGRYAANIAAHPSYHEARRVAKSDDDRARRDIVGNPALYLPARRVRFRLNAYAIFSSFWEFMTVASDQPASDDRAANVRSMVSDDHDRISRTNDPYVILNLDPDVSLEAARSRYERYEKFYRAGNFQRFDDMELTRRALDIRRAVGRAMATIQAACGGASDADDTAAEPELPDVDDNYRALGDIYFRDGLTYLKLRDLNAAETCLQQANDYDPSRGIILAYLGYTQFKLRANDPSVVDNSSRALERACRMESQNPEVFVLLARFAINTDQAGRAGAALDRVAQLKADHPKLAKLRERAARLEGDA